MQKNLKKLKLFCSSYHKKMLVFEFKKVAIKNFELSDIQFIKISYEAKEEKLIKEKTCNKFQLSLNKAELKESTINKLYSLDFIEEMVCVQVIYEGGFRETYQVPPYFSINEYEVNEDDTTVAITSYK